MTKTHLLKDNLSIVKARKVRALLVGQHPKIDILLDKLDHIITQPITIAVMGEFSAGKSSFLNRLLGIETLPVSVLPKTATLTRLVYGFEPCIEIEYYFNNEVIKHVGYDVFSELQRAAKINNPVFQQELEGIREIRVFVNNPILNRFHLLDTPGFNHDHTMDEKSINAIESADLIFWLSDCNQLGKQTEIEKLTLLKEKSPIYLIINKGDVNVSGSEAYQNTVTEISGELLKSGFISFFQSDEIFLISCKATDQFWDGIFQQFLARISEFFLNADLKISLDLIESQSTQLQKSLETELILYKQLQQRVSAFEDKNNLEVIFLHKNKELDNRLQQSLNNVMDSLHKHYKKCAQLNTDEIFSANSFVAEFLIQDLYNKFVVLQNDYSDYLNQWVQSYRQDLLSAFGEFFGLLPDHHHFLRTRINKIITYYDLEEEYGADIKKYFLSATDRTVKVLDQFAIREFNVKTVITSMAQRLNWKLEFQVITDGILNLNEEPKNMTFSRYVQLTVNDSIKADFLTHLNDILKNGTVIGIFKDLNTLCELADSHISNALLILEE